MDKLTTLRNLKRYKWYANLLLIFVMLGFVVIDYFIITTAIERIIEAGQPVPQYNNGFIWGALILGLLLVLNIMLFILEKCLRQVLTGTGR